MQNEMNTGAVYLQTNDAAKKEIVVHARAADGSLTYVGAYETGGCTPGASARTAGSRRSVASTGFPQRLRDWPQAERVPPCL